MKNKDLLLLESLTPRELTAVETGIGAPALHLRAMSHLARARKLLKYVTRQGQVDQLYSVVHAVQSGEDGKVTLNSLHATGVHGYLSLDVTFEHDLTFLVGTNGSGKTSALLLLMGLFIPSFPTLAKIEFSTARVNVEYGDTPISIEATRTSEGIRLGIQGIYAPPLEVSAAELQLLDEIEYEGGNKRTHPTVLDRLDAHPIVQKIRQISTPMFLGLDRRHNEDRHSLSDHRDLTIRRRLLRQQRHLGEKNSFTGSVVAGLLDVQILVDEVFSETRLKRSALETKLRNDIVIEAFSYEPITSSQAFSISIDDIRKVKSAQKNIKDASKSLNLPQIKQQIDNFYLNLNALTSRIEQNTPPRHSHRGSAELSPSDDPQAVIEWLVNRGQISRILRLVQLLEKYGQSRDLLDEPLARFVNIVNSFLSQTGKNLVINERGEAMVDINNSHRPLLALSSGERQIVVMFAHLSLNKQLAKSSIFIVDEPELSLHISWQEKFVESVRRANPHIQIVLATHSPAIIMGNAKKCVQVATAEAPY